MEKEELKEELKMLELPAQELTEEDLEAIAGGADDAPRRQIRDPRGRVIGEAIPKADGGWHIIYWRCPKCCRPMHKGKLDWFYCDPCDYKKFSTRYYTWVWSEEVLIRCGELSY